MKLFFLRHTSLNINPDIFYGQTDVDVSKNFNQEVEIIKEKLLNGEWELRFNSRGFESIPLEPIHDLFSYFKVFSSSKQLELILVSYLNIYNLIKNLNQNIGLFLINF